jgi:tRNA 2-thiouridine synthesizing protein A
MKRIAVVIATSEPSEALRAAVGLTLRGDRVSVVWRAPVPSADARVQRALAMLEATGHSANAPESAIAEADVVEVWSDPTPDGHEESSPAAQPGVGGLISCGSDTFAFSRAALDSTSLDGLLARLFAARVVIVWPDETLDLRGEVCPFTFVKTKLRLERIPSGARLRVLVDHEPATRNIPRSAADWGQRVLSVTPTPPAWEILIEKGPDR